VSAAPARAARRARTRFPPAASLPFRAVRPGSLRTTAANAARGLLMGSADVVPGVSGGTVALILGIYVRLLASIRAVVNAALALVRGDTAGTGRALREVELGLVVPLALGIGAALLTGARVIPPLLENHPENTSALFFGLIVASLAVPWRMLRRPGRRELIIAVGAALLAFVLTGFPEREISDPPLLAVFGAACLAICAMILPGVSGSFLLLAMGMYAPTLEAVDARDLLYVAVFGAGAAIGLGGFAKLLGWLLARHHDITMAVLLGLMVGSLRALWPWQEDDRGLQAPPADGSVLEAVGFGLLGLAIVTALIRVGRRAGGPPPPPPPSSPAPQGVPERPAERAGA
jgi:putative membrane protein